MTDLADAQVRGEYLTLVANGLMSTADVIWWATQEGKEALRPLTLWRLQRAVPGSSEQGVRQFLRQIATVSEAQASPNQMTIAWLLDRRCGGKRLVAFANLITEHAPPWPGFPYSPRPQVAG